VTSHTTSVPPSSAIQNLINLLKNSRSYSLDITPKLIYSSGPLVDLLVRSKVGSYLEFKPVDEVDVLWNGSLERVPASKEDIFKNGSVSLVDKRRLMKFITSVSSSTSSSASSPPPSVPIGQFSHYFNFLLIAFHHYNLDENITFADYLNKNGLKSLLSSMILYGTTFYTSRTQGLSGKTHPLNYNNFK
jgi:hypothetical protein